MRAYSPMSGQRAQTVHRDLSHASFIAARPTSMSSGSKGTGGNVLISASTPFRQALRPFAKSGPYTSGFLHLDGHCPQRARSNSRASMSASALSRKAVAVLELEKNASSMAFIARRQRPDPNGAIVLSAVVIIPKIILRSGALTDADTGTFPDTGPLRTNSRGKSRAKRVARLSIARDQMPHPGHRAA